MILPQPRHRAGVRLLIWSEVLGAEASNLMRAATGGGIPEEPSGQGEATAR